MSWPRKFPSLFLLFSFLCSFVVPSLFASPKIQSFEVNNDLVLFRVLGEPLEIQNEKGLVTYWQRMIYKWIRKKESISALFTKSNWLWLRFQDSEGYDLAFDLIKDSDLKNEREYYGEVWIKVENISSLKVIFLESISQAQFKRLVGERALLLNQVQAREYETKLEHIQALEKEIGKVSFWRKLNPLRVFRKNSKRVFQFPEDSIPFKEKGLPEIDIKKEFESKLQTKSQPFVPEAGAAKRLSEQSAKKKIDYTGTPATLTLHPDSNRLTDADVEDALLAFDSTESEDSVAQLEKAGAETNEDVAAYIAVLEEAPPTL